VAPRRLSAVTGLPVIDHSGIDRFATLDTVVGTMPDDVEAAKAAFSRLSADQQTLVGLCLRAIVDGPYVPDSEFQTVMGVTREEAAAVASAWPDPAAARFTFVAVSNTLNNFLGYPHKRWPELSEFIGADSRQLVAAPGAWRGVALPADPGRRYFESLE
jgi:hypothetical protein